MNKELIERIVTELEQSLPDQRAVQSWHDWRVRFAQQIIARIDAERGKKAVAWLDCFGEPFRNREDAMQDEDSCPTPLFRY